MKRCLSIFVLTAFTWTTVALAVPTTAPAADTVNFGPHVRALIAQAAKEGQLELSWSGSEFADNGKDLPKWIAALNKFYGLHLTYTFAPAPSMAQQSATLVQQAQSNTPASTDALVLPPAYVVPPMQAHALLTPDWVMLAKEVGVTLPAMAVASDRSAVAFATALLGFVYNKNAVAPKDVPKTLEDVLKPQWKGKVASTPYGAGFSFLAAFEPTWGMARTTAFVSKFSQQIGGLIRCGDPGPLLSGQFDMLVFECDISTEILEARSGLPLGYVIPSDAPLKDLWYMAVPKLSAHPAAGQLLALFMLTKQGQAISWQDDGNDLILFPGSRSAALLPNKEGIISTSQLYAEKPDAMKTVADLIKTLTSSVKK